ncbi:hypothetical protein PH586_12715 [Pseudomonas sp. SA3-5]|uniref:Uncharacterized protein n=1 Tax=Pseudomonas aestuarii TaxID=3018340 RepID=A0ABT4XG90_9PSED|nr:hypothetical protein [Pseudomonas aestuarii]MDA7087248.1 hypothetical protein [Pseudomonas aestuarii]
MHTTFAVAAILIVIALVIAIASHVRAQRSVSAKEGQEPGRSLG